MSFVIVHTHSHTCKHTIRMYVRTPTLQVNEAIEHGYVSRATVLSMDTDADGVVDLNEIKRAEEIADAN